jgi:xylulokinase
MYLGLDIGTSSVKAVLVDGADRVVATAERSLVVDRPHPLWSEQDPESWVVATFAAVDELAAAWPAEVAAVAGIGLSGQMHGAVLLDAADRVLRPAILWNDGRSAAECRSLEAAFPTLHAVTGNLAMPGFTAPKLLWVKAHEPAVFAATARVLLPKAFVRLRLTGEAVEDMSDASGTLWLDPAKRDWSDAALSEIGRASCRERVS